MKGDPLFFQLENQKESSFIFVDKTGCHLVLQIVRKHKKNIIFIIIII
jgi:hypothetical protein